MAKTRQQKEQVVKDLAEKLKKAKSLVFVNFAGLKVKETEKLRKNCRAENIDYVVAKKTLMKKAFKDAGITNIDPKSFAKEVAIALSYEDEVAPARILQNFAKEHEALVTFGGILEGQFVEQDKIIELAKLPTKSELKALVVGSIKAPISGLVNVLAGNLRNLVYGLNAIKDSKSVNR